MSLKKKKFNNIWKIIWIVGIYSVLILIFLLVINYKVEWETKDLNRYMYFYDCSNNVCTSDIEQNNYYGKMLCKDDICPYIIEQNNEKLILNDNNKIMLYDYKQDKIINEMYSDYYFINDNLIAVKNNENKYGLIDLNGDIVSELNYSKIIDYKNGYLIYNDEEKYNLKNIITNQDIINGYDYMEFINEKYLIVKEKQNYMLYNYNEKKIINQKYNYLYPAENYIITFNNKKIDILDKSLNSVLIIKINTDYEYTTSKEQGSLNFRKENGNLLFNVVNSENKYIVYSFNLSTGKLNN